MVPEVVLEKMALATILLLLLGDYSFISCVLPRLQIALGWCWFLG